MNTKYDRVIKFNLKLFFFLCTFFLVLQNPFFCASSKNNLKVKIVTNENGIADKSFNASIWNGVVKYFGDTPNNLKHKSINYDIAIFDEQISKEEFLINLCQEKNDLIIMPGYGFNSEIKKMLNEFPLQKFALIDTDAIVHENVMSFIFSEEEGSFLVGALCALQAKEDKIENPTFGFIGGIANSVITSFEMGFIQGINAVLPNARIVDFYTNSWNSPLSAKNKAKEWYESGVYAIFSAAGFSSTGVIIAAKEMRLDGKNVWAVGIDSDQFKEGIYSGTRSAVLTSMIKHTDNVGAFALDAIEKNKFTSCVVELSLKDNGVDYSKKNPIIKGSTIGKIEKFRQEIISGKRKIYSTYKETRIAGIAPSGLCAKDE